MSTLDEDPWYEAYDKAYVIKWWILLVVRSILFITALVISYRVFCISKRKEGLFILTLSLIIISVTIQLCITAEYFTHSYADFKEFIKTLTYEIAYCTYTLTRTLFRWAFAMQYTETCLTLPF